jgi:N-methylhydantoinase A
VPELGRFASCPVYDRYALAAGTAFTGPAIVEEPESTVYIGPRAKAVIARTGDLRVTLPQAVPSSRRRAESRKTVREEA